VDQDEVSVPTVKKEIEAIKRVLDYAKRNYGWPLEPQLPTDTRADEEIRGCKDQEPITPQDFKQVLTYIKPIDHTQHEMVLKKCVCHCFTRGCSKIDLDH
jgi:hypothetical protein